MKPFRKGDRIIFNHNVPLLSVMNKFVGRTATVIEDNFSLVTIKMDDTGEIIKIFNASWWKKYKPWKQNIE